MTETQQDEGWTKKDQRQEPEPQQSEFIALVGDIHGDPHWLRRIAEIPGVGAVIQLGDFYLPRHRVPQLPVPLFWIEGNHELWGTVPPVEPRTITETAPGCFHVGRGFVLHICGLRLLCGGGADSVDRAYQMRYNAWSEREQWSADDEVAMCAASNVDAIITHSPPQSVIAAHFDPNDLTRYFGLPNTWVSPVAEAIERVWQHHGKPPLYCGHMHRAVIDGSARILDIGEVILLSATMLPERAVVLAVDRSRSTPDTFAPTSASPSPDSGTPRGDL
jgi:hypothetical protein